MKFINGGFMNDAMDANNDHKSWGGGECVLGYITDVWDK